MRIYEFASMGSTASGAIATVATPLNKKPIKRVKEDDDETDAFGGKDSYWDKKRKAGEGYVAYKPGKKPSDEPVKEMYGEGYAGFRVYNVNTKVYQSLRGWFPDAHTDFDPREGTANVYFDGGVTAEIDAKMDRFNSNWQTQSDGIQD